MKAYHFLRADMTAGSGNEKAWAVGETRRIKGDVKLCERGYHSSPSPYDALGYAQGTMLCLVDVSRPTEKDPDKQVSRRRTLLKAVNVERALHEVACRIAEDALPLYENRCPNDKRPHLAIEAKRKWLRGEITGTELDAAWAAAWDAAGAAARDAWAAAGDAAGAAARDAAWAAAWDAAGAAARDAWAAAWAAAGDAAWAAAGAAVGVKYKNWINEALLLLIEVK